MRQIITKFIRNSGLSILAAAVLVGGCGVKGKPLAPLTPPLLGRGEPNFSKATEKLKIQKNKKTGSLSGNKVSDDFADSPEDFQDEEAK